MLLVGEGSTRGPICDRAVNEWTYASFGNYVIDSSMSSLHYQAILRSPFRRRTTPTNGTPTGEKGFRRAP